MANENICVFCGEKMGFFHAMTVTCAGYYLPCCKNCYKELKNLPEEEQCRRQRDIIESMNFNRKEDEK